MVDRRSFFGWLLAPFVALTIPASTPSLLDLLTWQEDLVVGDLWMDMDSDDYYSWNGSQWDLMNG